MCWTVVERPCLELGPRPPGEVTVACGTRPISPQRLRISLVVSSALPSKRVLSLSSERRSSGTCRILEANTSVVNIDATNLAHAFVALY